MIIDNLKNTQAYEHIHPLFKKAFEYLATSDFTNIAEGRYDIDNDNIFAIVSENTLKAVESSKLELHNKYIDIQVPLDNKEGFGWKSRKLLNSPSADFDKDRDIQFFEDKIETLVNIAPGNFVIFFPEDAHAPCIGEQNLKKVVVKVKL